jgi:hypothetical protein
MNQGLVGSPGQECVDDIGISDVGQLIALLGETSDVFTDGLIWLLPTVLEVPGVPRAHVGAMKFPVKISFRSAQSQMELGGRCSSHVQTESARNKGRLWIMK